MSTIKPPQSLRRAATSLGLNPRTLRRLIHAGEVRAVRIPTSWLIEQDEVDRLLEAKK